MSNVVIAAYIVVGVAILALAHLRPLFPYLVVAVLGLEYFSFGSSADSAFTIPKIGFLALLGSQIFSGRFRRVFAARGMFTPMLMLCAFLSLTTLWSVDAARSITRAISLFQLLVLFVVIQGFIRAPKDVHAFWRAYLMYAFANSVFAIYQILAGTTLIEDNLGARAGGLGVNPSEGAYYTILGVLILSVYFANRRAAASWPRSLAIQVFVACTLMGGLFATGSRGGVVALAVAGIVAALLSQEAGAGPLRAMLRYGVLAAIVVAVLLVTTDLSKLVVERFASSAEDGFGNRFTIWARILILFLNHPILGNGLNAAAIESGPLDTMVTYSSHNTPLGVLLDGGLVGVALLLFVALRTWSVLRDIRRGDDSGRRLLGLILWTLIIASFMLMLSYDLMYNKLLWALLALVDGTRQLYRVPKRASLASRPTTVSLAMGPPSPRMPPTAPA